VDKAPIKIIEDRDLMRYVRMTVEKVKVRELGEIDDLFRRLVEQEVTVSIENFKKPREPD
jgi:hypothetical protein